MLDLLAGIVRTVRPFVFTVVAGLAAVLLAGAIADWRSDRRPPDPPWRCPM